MTRIARLSVSASAVVAVSLLTSLPVAGEQRAAPVAPAYTAKCAGCHGPAMEGAFGPSLNDSTFKGKWAGRSFAELASYIHSSMPPSNPGSLAAGDVTEIVRSIQQVNGFSRWREAGEETSEHAQAEDVNPEAAAGGVARGSANTDDYYRARIAERARRLESLTPVSEAMLTNPSANDWLSVRRTDDSLAFSPLKQIDRKSVSRLSLGWSYALAAGSNAITPLVHDGVMFVNSNGEVKALDVASGDELWSFTRPASVIPLGDLVSQPRSMAVLGHLLYVPTVDNHMIALDIRSGKVVWDHLIQKADTTLRITGAPLVVRGKIIQGMSGCAGAQEKSGCFVTALDAATGKELWRFYTIPRAGEPGADSWNGEPFGNRFGGSIWSTATYDADTGLIYIGTAQTYQIAPLLENRATTDSKKALYTNTTLALDPDTGKLAWHYQHMEREVWDLDWSFERYSWTMPTKAGPRRVVGTIGKLGILDVLDARTGEYVTSFDMGMQNLVTAIDAKTGRKTTDPAFEPKANVPLRICPFAGGIRNWPSTSFDVSKGVLYVPFTRSCMTFLHKPGGGFDISYAMEPPPGNDPNVGGVMAIDMKTLAPAWVYRHRAPAASGALATAGGVVFAGDRDRWFRALDAATGSVLWQTRLDRRLSGNPITFAHQGQQYVAITSGGGTPYDATQQSLTPESPRNAAGVTLWVFKLQ